MEETVFSKIIRHEIPADIVYEDNDVVAFLDIRPNQPGHTLVVPKTYARNIFDINEKEWASLTETVRKVAAAVKEAMHADGINISMNNEPAAGQIVFHAHVHIIPRFEKDSGYSGGHTYKPGEATNIANKIRAALV
ncbi:MAG: HIT family protein [Patescibacteria group bacterium]